MLYVATVFQKRPQSEPKYCWPTHTKTHTNTHTHGWCLSRLAVDAASFRCLIMPQPPVTAVQGVNHRLIKTLPFNQLLCRQLTNLQRFFAWSSKAKGWFWWGDMAFRHSETNKRLDNKLFSCAGWGGEALTLHWGKKLLGCKTKCVEFYKSVAGFWFLKPEG